jgi:hypothetical protein
VIGRRPEEPIDRIPAMHTHDDEVHIALTREP